jgi:hypothetical protein
VPVAFCGCACATAESGGFSGMRRVFSAVGMAGLNRVARGVQQERPSRAACCARSGRSKSAGLRAIRPSGRFRFDSICRGGIRSDASPLGWESVGSGPFRCPGGSRSSQIRSWPFSAAAADFGGLRRSRFGEVKLVK